MPAIKVKNTFGFDTSTDPRVVGDTIAKAFNVEAAKFEAYGPLCAERGGKFVAENPPAEFMIVTDQETADSMKKQRPGDVTFFRSSLNDLTAWKFSGTRGSHVLYACGFAAGLTPLILSLAS